MKKKLLLLTAALAYFAGVMGQVAPIAQAVKGRVICGYQGWFNAYGDGSPIARWRHWSGGQFNTNNGAPSPGHISFEVYPDVSEYGPAQLFQTNLGNLNDGSASKLYTSYHYETLDLHFKWMQQYGIDGVALQRFLGETKDGVFKRNRDSITVWMKRAAEKYQRSFYVMYDMSADDTTYFKNDWLHIENDLNVLGSPYYAHQDGKPVICLWGFGFTGRANVPAHSLAIINWLKNKGYYVIGGVPTNWRTSSSDSHAGYNAVYDAFDMLSPWTVGRFGNITGIDNFKNNYLVPDLAYCNTKGIDYQPVIFSGFAWSNWNGGPVNEMPRNKGEFYWRQLYNIKNLGLNTAYIAMFDEYDEGTNIIKMADSYFAVPNNQYFLTSSADGVYISPDFYLRLTGQATQVLKGTAPLTANVSIPYSNGPLWFRTSVQPGYDAVLTWTDSADPSSVPRNVSNPLCGIVSNETSKTGNASIRVAGRDNSATGGSFHYFRAFDVNIPVNANTKMSYWMYPTNNLSRYVAIDLLMTDGTALRNTTAIDQTGASMHPGAGHGTVNTWQQIRSNIGSALNGKTIDRIIIAYDHGADTGSFKTYFDDIVITDQPLITSLAAAQKLPDLSPQMHIFPQPARDLANIRFTGNWNGEGEMAVYNANGQCVSNETVRLENNRITLPLDGLPAGVYFVRVSKGQGFAVKKMVVVR